MTTSHRFEQRSNNATSFGPTSGASPLRETSEMPPESQPTVASSPTPRTEYEVSVRSGSGYRGGDLWKAFESLKKSGMGAVLYKISGTKKEKLAEMPTVSTASRKKKSWY